MKRLWWLVSLGVLLNFGSRMTAEAVQRLKVVTTLSTYADLAKAVGGDYIDVSYVASPKFNPHFIEPKPSDVMKVKRADVFLHSGLDLELWRGPLLDAAANREAMPGGSRELDLSRGVRLLETPDHPLSRAEGDIHLYGNPHYWIDPDNGKIIAQEICDKLSAIDPPNEPDYRRNLVRFLEKLDAKIPVWQQRLAPFKSQELIGYHNEWPYLMRFTGLRMERFLETKPGIPPTLQHIAFLEQYVKEHHIRVIVQPTYYPPEAASQLAARTGIKVVTLCTNVGEVPEASDFIAMIDHDVEQLAKALSQ